MPAFKIVVLGLGNLLCSDDGFGVHLVRHLRERYDLPEHVELVEGGTMGLLLTGFVEDATRLYLADALLDPARPPGSCLRFNKDEFLWKEIPLRLSPHQVGLREMLWLAEWRGRAPAEVTLMGVTPVSVAPGTELSPPVRQCLERTAAELALELQCMTVGAVVSGRASRPV